LAHTRELFTPVNDGLFIPEVGSWAEIKYKIVSLYETMFSSGMKTKWGKRVYVDLYSGAGYCRIRDSNRLLAGSPILALTVPTPFDKYIFCEEDPVCLSALKQRVKTIAPEADVTYISGDCNERIDDICSEIPQHSPGNTVLSFCFVDPFDIGIRFTTIQRLAERYIDFLILLAVQMDAGRNYAHYIEEGSPKVDNFLGNRDWRAGWARTFPRPGFPEFLATEYARQMESLDYKATPLYLMKRVRSDEKNLPLYYLSLFSRHELAYKFWDDVLKYETEQQRLF